MVNGPKVLCIAGVDSTGLAGVDQDRRTLQALGGAIAVVATAQTQQEPGAKQRVDVEDPQAVFDAIQQVLLRERIAVVKIAAVKIGMLGSLEMVESVLASLQDFEGPVVLDTVLQASSGLPLLPEKAWPALKQLANRCTLVTPNLLEFSALGGKAWQAQLQVPILIKGGHAQGENLVDCLLWPNGEVFQKSHPRMNLANSRGTGCALSSAIAWCLALGMPLQEAVSEGIEWQQASFRAQTVP